LQDAEWACGIWSNTVLEVADNLALEPNHEHGRHQKERKNSNDLEQDNEHDGEVNLSGEKRIATKHR